MTTDRIEYPSNDDYTFLNGKQLAEVLDVSAPSLSQAVKNGHNCGGFPVCDWARISESGRTTGFDVPTFLVENNNDNQKPQVNQTNRKKDSIQRINPDNKVPNEPNINPNEAQIPAFQAPKVSNTNYSLLPKGVDYVRPASMIALPAVLKKALEKDSPQSRAVIGGLLAILGAITGHAVTDNAAGAGIGASAGFSIALYMFKNYKLEQKEVRQFIRSNGVGESELPGKIANKSRYVPN